MFLLIIILFCVLKHSYKEIIRLDTDYMKNLYSFVNIDQELDKIALAFFADHLAFLYVLNNKCKNNYKDTENIKNIFSFVNNFVNQGLDNLLLDVFADHHAFFVLNKCNYSFKEIIRLDTV